MLNFIKKIFKISPIPGLRDNVVAFVKSSDDANVTMLGYQASSALKNPAFDAAFKKIEANIIHAWKTSAQKDGVAREHLYYRIEALAEIKIQLHGMLNNMLFENNKKKKQGQS